MQSNNKEQISSNSTHSDALNNKINSFFQPFFKNGPVNLNATLYDLGFESIDFMELAVFLLENTSKWLDITKINHHTTLSDLPSHLVEPVVEQGQFKKMVEMDKSQYYIYAHELNTQPKEPLFFVVHRLHLKETIDIAKLKKAIQETSNSHFILNSKLVRQAGDYFFEKTHPQDKLVFKGSRFFPKKDLAALKINIDDDRLVNIYIQTKKGQHYLIISFHHVAMDGWSYKIIEEEIFRRYAGLPLPAQKKPIEEIKALNSIYPTSMSQKSNATELESLFESIEPEEYGCIDHLFKGACVANNNCFVIPRKDLQHYTQAHNIQGVPHSAIFAFILYQIIRTISSTNKLRIYVNNSNRYLPIAGIANLITNCVTGYPLLLDNSEVKSEDFIKIIDRHLKIYFKHMSYGSTTNVLLENKTSLNRCVSLWRNPYYVLLTYINNTSKLIYGTDSISSNYVNWNTSKLEIPNSKKVLLCVHNMGHEFVIRLYTSMVKGGHQQILETFKTLFPCLESQI